MKLIWHFVKKEFLQLKRDPKMVRVIILAPILELLLLGYAANMDVEKIHTALFDKSNSQLSREFVRKLKASGYFYFDFNVSSYKELQEKIDGGEVILGLVIPNDFETKIAKGETAKIQAVFDASDGNSATISAGYLQIASNNFAQSILEKVNEKSGVKNKLPGTIKTDTRVWFNPELKTRVFMVPGIMSLLLMIFTISLTALAIVKEKEIGTLEQIIVTPIKPYQMILGKFIPFVIIGLFVISLVLISMEIFFGILIKGSLIFLFVSSLVFVLSTLGLGLFISTFTKTQQQAMMIAMFGVMMPMIYLSGFAFPIENMPVSIQYISFLIPLRYFITIIRGVILKGLGLRDLWVQFVVLILFGIVILYLSSLRFKKKMD